MERGGPLRRVSKKRAAESAQRSAVKRQVGDRDGARCAARYTVPEVTCWHPDGRGALDGDERVKRSARPGGHLDPENVQLLCRAHHDWKEANPIEAAHRRLRPYPISYTGVRVDDDD